VTNASLRLLVCAGVLVLVVTALTGVNDANAAGQRTALLEEIDQYRTETWSWQRLMRARLTPTNYSELNTGDAYREWVRDLWKGRAERMETIAQDPPHERAWRCIHRYEALHARGWATRTGNGYFGGLQMSMEFQRVLAPELLRAKGTADNWTAIEQMWVAERAIDGGYGFTPWPNTARACGLL
jgi:Transglycosylase-like domain